MEFQVDCIFYSDLTGMGALWSLAITKVETQRSSERFHESKKRLIVVEGIFFYSTPWRVIYINVSLGDIQIRHLVTKVLRLLGGISRIKQYYSRLQI